MTKKSPASLRRGGSGGDQAATSAAPSPPPLLRRRRHASPGKAPVVAGGGGPSLLHAAVGLVRDLGGACAAASRAAPCSGGAPACAAASWSSGARRLVVTWPCAPLVAGWAGVGRPCAARVVDLGGCAPRARPGVCRRLGEAAACGAGSGRPLPGSVGWR
ncbi:hypothetical protein VPH35_053805 [Triticum aestivum]